MFSNVIVRKPSKSVVDGLTTSNLGKPIYDKALEQHNEYIRALKSCGVKVHILEADEEFPDGCFVEDPAVVTEKCAIITNPSTDSRKNEIYKIEKALTSFYDKVEHITEGTLEGGDVMRIKDHFYIGLSNRTNLKGAENLIRILNKYGYTGSVIKLKEMFHLKTGVNYLEDDVILVAGEFIENSEFNEFKKIVVDEDEMYAANCIRINDYVIMPADFPKMKQKIINEGFNVKEVNMTEFRKIDGGLSCLSLRF